MPVVHVDLKRGGYAHDLHSAPVAARIRAIAGDPRCRRVLGSIPCTTWSPARSAPGEGWLSHSKPMRRCSLGDDRRTGVPGPDGKLPEAVEKANACADLLADACASCFGNGGDYIIETTPSRGRGAAYPIRGREDHVGMLDHPSMVKLAGTTGAHVLHFDQCMTRDDPELCPEKKTVLLYSPRLAAVITREFAPLMCNHSAGVHPSMLGLSSGGEARSSQWEQYSSNMNARLARCLGHESAPAGGAVGARAAAAGAERA